MSFETNYWSEIYAGRLIDGTFNASKHADYIKSIFALSEFPIRKIIDIGFGKGKILEQVAKKLHPDHIIALDTSKLMVETLKKKTWIGKYNIAIAHTKFEEFNTDYLEKYPLDLAIANSVFQYIEDVDFSLKKLASIALKLSQSPLCEKLFIAPGKTKTFYLEILNKYFTRVSFNVLESKIVREHSYFTAELYRG